MAHVAIRRLRLGDRIIERGEKIPPDRNVGLLVRQGLVADDGADKRSKSGKSGDSEAVKAAEKERDEALKQLEAVTAERDGLAARLAELDPEVAEAAKAEVEGGEDLSKLKRAELNKLAEAAGVPEPGKLANKDEVIKQLEAARAAG